VEDVHLTLPAEPASVAAARRAVGALASRLECDAGAVRIAVSEAVGNSVRHAYPEGSAGKVVVLARILRGRLVVTVGDRGAGLRPRLDSDGLGIGLPVVSRLADDVRIESDERGTAISMSFGCSRVPPANDTAATQAGVEGELERARELIHRRGGRRSVRGGRSRRGRRAGRGGPPSSDR
jgi:serine/threonine-protein kinase RsbW